MDREKAKGGIEQGLIKYKGKVRTMKRLNQSITPKKGNAVY